MPFTRLLIGFGFGCVINFFRFIFNRTFHYIITWSLEHEAGDDGMLWNGNRTGNNLYTLQKYIQIQIQFVFVFREYEFRN